MTIERRRAPRYPFIAAAELIETQSQAQFKARTSELGLYGCYLDMLNPLPQGTEFLLRITHDNATFEALSRAVYEHPNMGMGVAFTSMESNSQAILNNWLRQLSGE